MYAEIWKRIEEIESRMSINESKYQSTEILELNRQAGRQAVEISADTLAVLQQAINIGHLSDGAFDASIEPLISLWDITGQNPGVPSATPIAEAARHVDLSLMQIDENRAFLPMEGMGVDLGGVAKGYAAGEAARLLEEAGFCCAILNFGGDIVTIGEKPDGSDWRIGIQHPAMSRGNLLGAVQIRGSMSVVTSGTYERGFEQDGIRYHHLLDPKTGFPAQNGLTSVTVVAADPTQADALATAAFVLGPKRGMDLLTSLPNTEGIFVRADGIIEVSQGLQDRFSLLSDDFVIAGNTPTAPASQ